MFLDRAHQTGEEEFDDERSADQRAADLAAVAQNRVITEGRQTPAWATKMALMLSDLAAVAIGFGVAMFVVDRIGGWAEGRRTHDLQVLAVSMLTWLLVFVRLRIYQHRFVSTRAQEIVRLGKAVIYGTAAMVMIDALWDNEGLRRTWLLVGTLLTLLFLVMEREIVRRRFARSRQQGKRMRRVAIVGENDEATALRDSIGLDPTLGFEFVGHLRLESLPDGIPTTPLVLGSVADAPRIVAEHEIGHVLIAGSAAELDTTKRLARALHDQGVQVEISPTLPDITTGRLTVRPLGRFPVLYLEAYTRSAWRARAKRMFDFLAALAGLVAVSPILIGTALAIKMDSRGPVFYRQTRLGQNGSHFGVIKFRSMVQNAHELKSELTELNEADGPLFKLEDDPRVTRVGRFIRKVSIDELPQLWNVVKGEMSLVGPRPALPEEAEEWPEELHDRLRAKPGITGMWQVSGRSSASFDDYSRLDLFYVDNWSLTTDVEILARTVPVVVTGRGAS